MLLETFCTPDYPERYREHLIHFVQPRVLSSCRYISFRPSTYKAPTRKSAEQDHHGIVHCTIISKRQLRVCCSSRVASVSARTKNEHITLIVVIRSPGNGHVPRSTTRRRSLKIWTGALSLQMAAEVVAKATLDHNLFREESPKMCSIYGIPLSSFKSAAKRPRRLCNY